MRVNSNFQNPQSVSFKLNLDKDFKRAAIKETSSDNELKTALETIKRVESYGDLGTKLSWNHADSFEITNKGMKGEYVIFDTGVRDNRFSHNYPLAVLKNISTDIIENKEFRLFLDFANKNNLDTEPTKALSKLYKKIDYNTYLRFKTAIETETPPFKPSENFEDRKRQALRELA